MPPRESIFPEVRYLERYRSFSKCFDKPCGLGCAYNCCDPIITSIIMPKAKAERNFQRTLRATEQSLRKDIGGDENVLELVGFFVAPSFFRECLVKGPDFGINIDRTFLQVYLLFGCPRLNPDGLCSIYNKPGRFNLCSEFKGCPEYCIKETMPESSFLTLSFNYWLMRKLIIGSSATDTEQAERVWAANEKMGLRAFLIKNEIRLNDYG